MLSIGAAADRLGTTPRMLRYRERLGLLPDPRHGPGTHRRYDEAALASAARAADLEQRYAVPPAALAFAVRVLSDAAVADDVRRLGELTGRLVPAPIAALDFDQRKAQGLLGRPGGREAPERAVGNGTGGWTAPGRGGTIRTDTGPGGHRV